MGMMIFRLIAGPPKKFPVLPFRGFAPCVRNQGSEVMYQQAALVVHKHHLRIPYTSLYGKKKLFAKRELQKQQVWRFATYLILLSTTRRIN
mgnify:CR=1 FL=1|jgi:hypothetical protein